MSSEIEVEGMIAERDFLSYQVYCAIFYSLHFEKKEIQSRVIPFDLDNRHNVACVKVVLRRKSLIFLFFRL